MIKVDDNGVVNYKSLLDHLLAKHGPSAEGQPDGLIECPSPMRNVRPWRPGLKRGNSTIMGKWSIKTSQMSRRFVFMCRQKIKTRQKGLQNIQRPKVIKAS